MAKLTAKQIETVVAAVNADFTKRASDAAYETAIEALTKLPEAAAKPVIAEKVAEKYGVAVSSKIAERGPKAGQTIYVFGAGSSNGKAEKDDTNARMAFGRLCNAAWPAEGSSNDGDAAEALLKALKRVVSGRAKLSKADKVKFARLAKAEGVSFA